MAYYNVCPRCGAALDPGERCDCETEQEKQHDYYAGKMRMEKSTGQYVLILGDKELGYAEKVAN